MGGKFYTLAALSAWICTFGAIVLQFLLHTHKFFFLHADTRGIPNAANGITHWSLSHQYGPGESGTNDYTPIQCDCTSTGCAYPLGFRTDKNITHDIVANLNRYLSLEGHLYASNVIAVLPAMAAVFLGPLTLSGDRLVARLATLAAATAALVATVAACITTAYYTMAQNAFRRAGKFARIGVKAIAISWTAAALLSLATLGFATLAAWQEARSRRPASSAGGGRENGRSVDGRHGGTRTGGSGGGSGGGGVAYQFGPMRHHRSREIPHHDGDPVEGGESIRAGVRY